MNVPAITSYLQDQGYPPYRLRQILQNYYSGRFSNFLGMSDLPINLRQNLDNQFSLLSLQPINLFHSKSSRKAVLNLLQGNLRIESVLMDYSNWSTVCLSTQIGCPLGCLFCATGKMGYKRNLTVEEIIDQVLFWKNQILPKENHIPRPVQGGDRGGFRLVFMGMGEPFLNWDNLLDSLKIINQKLDIGARKISISTAGIIPRIYDFADLNTDINLAISLHSLRHSVRQQIMPVSRQYHLDDLIKSLHYYTTKTHRQLFLEYALIRDVNDSQQDIDLLIKLLRSNYLFHLNLIPLNSVEGGLLPSVKLDLFRHLLSFANINFTVRRSLGSDISSACGQLITRQ